MPEWLGGLIINSACVNTWEGIIETDDATWPLNSRSLVSIISVHTKRTLTMYVIATWTDWILKCRCRKSHRYAPPAVVAVWLWGLSNTSQEVIQTKNFPHSTYKMTTEYNIKNLRLPTYVYAVYASVALLGLHGSWASSAAAACSVFYKVHASIWTIHAVTESTGWSKHTRVSV